MAFRTPAFNDSKLYGFEWLRYLAETSDVQEGVVGAGDMKVTAAAGGGMKVDLAAGAAYVKGDSGIAAVGLSQGLFLIVNDAAIPNAVTLAASDPSLPRIDQICLRVRDSSDLATGADDATPLVVAGTATSGATLDNRTGAAALPNDHVRLADVLVPAGSSAVSAGNVRDRRPWARGAYTRKVSTTAVARVGITALAIADATNLNPRVECSGSPLRVGLRTNYTLSGGGNIDLAMFIDAAQVALAAGGTVFREDSLNGMVSLEWDLLPAAGSHLVAPAFSSVNAAITATFNTQSNPQTVAVLTVEEIVRQNADNT